MTEETKVIDEVPELTPTEQTATEQGWVPKEEWVADGKSEDDWRPAKEFVDRGELYKTIHTTKRELKQTQQALTVLQKHNAVIFEKAHLKAVADLKKERREAARDGDVDRVEQVEEDIEQVQKEHQQAVQEVVQATQVATAGPHPEYVEWVGRNGWYNNDSDLREFADATGLIYMQKNPGVPPVEVLKYVESKVKKQFADKFGRRAAPNAVAGVDKSNSGKTRTTTPNFELTDEETNVMNTLVKSGTMTKAEYIEQLKKVR